MKEHNAFKYYEPDAPTPSGLYYPSHIDEGVWTYCYYLGSIALSRGKELDLGICDNCGSNGVLSATAYCEGAGGYRSFPVVNYDDDHWDNRVGFSDSFTDEEIDRIKIEDREYNAALYERAERLCFPVYASYEDSRNDIVHTRLVYDTVNGYNNR